MKSFSILFFASLLWLAPAAGQTADNSEARKARLHANLLFLFPQLEEYQVTIGQFEPSVVTGMEEGSFVINGQQVQRFLTDPQDETLYMIAGGPFNAGLSSGQIVEMKSAREREASAEARDTHEKLLAAVAGMPIKGPVNAPVTIVEFSDFQCPYCAAAVDTLRKVVARYPNDVRIVYAQFPLESIHPWARIASVAALCAAEQSEDAFWTLHDSYFAGQKGLTKENVLEQSRAKLTRTGIDLDAWSTCAGDPTSEGYLRANTAIDQSIAIGSQFGVGSTPSFFVNGYAINGAKSSALFMELIERAKKEASE
ncbi:MAG: DsbA family protein [Rhodothermales bacterium]